MFEWITQKVHQYAIDLYNALLKPPLSYVSAFWDITKTVSYKSYNYLWTSRLHIYSLEMQNKVVLNVIKQLMDQENLPIESRDNKHPMLPYMLGPLTEKAKKVITVLLEQIYITISH